MARRRPPHINPHGHERRLLRTGIAWQEWLSLWQDMGASRLPGFATWERDVFRLLSEHLGILFRIFSFYAKLASVRALAELAAPAGPDLQGLVLHSVEWLIFLKDCKLTTSKLGTAHTVELLPQPVDSAGAPAGAPFVSFLSGLLGIAFWRANAGRGAETATAVVRGTRRLRPLPECISSVLRDSVLPLARRDTSQRFRARCMTRSTPSIGHRAHRLLICGTAVEIRSAPLTHTGWRRTTRCRSCSDNTGSRCKLCSTV